LFTQVQAVAALLSSVLMDQQQQAVQVVTVLLLIHLGALQLQLVKMLQELIGTQAAQVVAVAVLLGVTVAAAQEARFM
jgi:cytochrome c biogenesis protein CcdA